MQMTQKAIVELCDKHGLYRTPAVNDKMYLHYKGFRKIENLEAYTGLKCLYLEGNGFNKIEGLTHQPEMRTLYLHENLIEKIENLEKMPKLIILNLCKNSLESIENIGCLKELKTLLAAFNHLENVQDLAGLLECPTLEVIDLQGNRLKDPAVVDLLVKMPNLKCLYLKGNPCVRDIRHYRKKVIARLPLLNYLDDRPVFPKDRERAEAFYEALQKTGDVKAAQAAERGVIKMQRQREKEKDERNFRAFGEMIRKARQARGEEPDSDEEEVKYSKFSGEKIIDYPENPILKAAREKAEAQYCGRLPPVPAGESADAAEKAPPLPPAGGKADDSSDEDLRDEQDILEEKLRGIGHNKAEDIWAYVDGKPNRFEKELEKDIFHKSYKATEETETKKKQPDMVEVLDAIKKVDPDAGATLEALHKMQQQQHVDTPQPQDDSFIPSATFTGSKKGFVFQQGKQGLGYYIDSVQQPSDSRVEDDDIPPPLETAPPLPEPATPALEATDLEALD